MKTLNPSMRGKLEPLPRIGRNVRLRRKVLLIGNSKETQAIAENVNKISNEYSVVGCMSLCPRMPEDPQPGNVPVLGDFMGMKTFLEKPSSPVDIILITDPEVRHHQVMQSLQMAREHRLELWVVPQLSSALLGHLRFFNFHGHPVIKIHHPPERIKTRKLVFKNAFDWACALAGLALSAPLMLLIALMIKVTSPGPVFFKQERVGKNGNIFKVIKFRSMHMNAEKNSGPVLSEINDQRVTWFGNILRKTHLDELPQFLNILNGTMSMIGPRPERPFFVENFVRLIPFYSDRFAVKPGITGMAQVYGSYHSKAEEKLIFDLNYIHNLGLFLDIKLCFLTVIEAIKTFFK